MRVAQATLKAVLFACVTACGADPESASTGDPTAATTAPEAPPRENPLAMRHSALPVLPSLDPDWSAWPMDSRLALDLIRAEVPTLVFGQSRNTVEVILKYLRDRLAERALETLHAAIQSGFGIFEVERFEHAVNRRADGLRRASIEGHDALTAALQGTFEELGARWLHLFALREPQRAALEMWEAGENTISLKARQIGWSTLSADGARRFIDEGDNTYGGKFVTNPSGGLLSKGHPLGATGLAQCTELVWHLRGQAEDRQVEGARVALQHNLGLGGAAVVTMYRRD